MKRSWVAIASVLAFVVLAPVGEAVAQPTPGQSASDGPESETQKLVKSYAFRGTTLAWWQNFNAINLSRGSEQTWNPSYTWFFRFWPRYNVTNKLSLRLKLDLFVELTNADDTTKLRETQLGDTWFDIAHGGFKEPFTGIDFIPSFRIVFPTSKTSQARSLYTGLSPGFTVNRTFTFGSMDLSIAWSFRYTKHLNKYTTVQYDAPSIASCSAGSADCGQFLHTGVRNPSHDFWNILSLDYGITSKLRVSLMAGWYHALLYGLTPANVAIAGGATVPVSTAGDVGYRTAMYYYGDVSYQVHPALNLAIGFSTFNPQLAEDSTYRQPFINRFTEIQISTTIAIDHLVALFDKRTKK